MNRLSIMLSSPVRPRPVLGIRPDRFVHGRKTVGRVVGNVPRTAAPGQRSDARKRTRLRSEQRDQLGAPGQRAWPRNGNRAILAIARLAPFALRAACTCRLTLPRTLETQAQQVLARIKRIRSATASSRASPRFRRRERRRRIPERFPAVCGRRSSRSLRPGQRLQIRSYPVR